MSKISYTNIKRTEAEYQMQIKAQKHELQANMDWLKSKGIFELELEMPDMKGIELSLTAY
jgi:hypothetical protein